MTDQRSLKSTTVVNGIPTAAVPAQWISGLSLKLNCEDMSQKNGIALDSRDYATSIYLKRIWPPVRSFSPCRVESFRRELPYTYETGTPGTQILRIWNFWLRRGCILVQPCESRTLCNAMFLSFSHRVYKLDFGNWMPLYKRLRHLEHYPIKSRI